MKFFKRIIFKIIRIPVDIYLKKRGIKNAYIRRVFANSLIKDWKTCDKSTSEKIWAIKRGFYPNRVDMWGLNEENYKRFLSDLDYRKIFPLNNYFQKWIDDKITTRYVLQDSRFKDLVPRYYIYIENDGNYSYMMDFNQQIGKNTDALLNLLKVEKILALKPVAGSLGIGFIKLEMKGSEIYANNKFLSINEFNELKSSLRGYIVTEYCRQHKKLDKVWQDSECTLRIVVAKFKDQFGGGKCKALLSYARFGSSLSSSTSNLSQGGLGVTIDFETGILGDMFYRKKQFVQNGSNEYDIHPDTHVRLAGERLPNWDIVKKGIYDLADYLSPLEYFGFDIIITEEGFKICEINSFPNLDMEQIMFGPMLDNEDAKIFFTSKLQKV